jgi:hypothetical protein
MDSVSMRPSSVRQGVPDSIGGDGFSASLHGAETENTDITDNGRGAGFLFVSRWDRFFLTVLYAGL